MIPKIIKNFNLFVDGQGFAGRVDDTDLSKVLALVTEDHRGGGMDTPVRIDMGVETPEVSFSMAEHNPIIFKKFGLIDQNSVQLTFRAAQVDDRTVLPYIINARGMYMSIDAGTIEAGKKTPLKATLSCRYIRISAMGESVIEIDVDNMVRSVGGADQMAAIRGVLGM